MISSRISLLFLLGLLPFSVAQSSTPPSSATFSVSSSSPTSRPTRSIIGTQTINGTTTSFPSNGTVTLSANGTATATIVNGTAVNASATATSSAAFPTLSGVSPCIVDCLQNSVALANCSSITDETCFCSSTTFRNAMVNCVSTQCFDELKNAEDLAQRFCSMVSVTLTFPTPTIPTSRATAAPTSDGVRESRRPAVFAASCALGGLAWLALGW